MFKITLEAARVNAHLTQGAVAEALKVSNTTIVNWEKGRAKPSQATLIALSALYNCPIEIFSLPFDLTESKEAVAN